MQRPANRVVGVAPPGGEFQDVLEQGDGPAGVGIAVILRRADEECRQQVLLILAQCRAASPARFVVQRRRIMGVQVGVYPVVDALPGHPEHPG